MLREGGGVPIQPSLGAGAACEGVEAMVNGAL